MKNATPDREPRRRGIRPSKPLRPLVLGLGTRAYGKERQVAGVFAHAAELDPYFLLSKWAEDDVVALLKRKGLRWGRAPIGYLGRARLDWTAITIAYLPLTWCKVLNAFRKQADDVVVTVDLGTVAKTFPVLWLLRHLLGARIVLYIHGIPESSAMLSPVRTFVRWNVDVTIACSKAVAEGLRQAGFDRPAPTVVYNGISLQEFPFRESEGTGASSGTPLRVGYAGQINPNKGIEDFLTAARMLVDRLPGARFLVAGPLDFDTSFARVVRNRIRELSLESSLDLLGHVDNMSRFYRNLDVMVVPSRYEAFGLVNVEAMATGLPVVATRVGGIPEIVEDGKTGFLVPPEAPEEIAAAVQQLASNPKQRRRMGRRGREVAEKRFNIQRTAREVRDLLFEKAPSLPDCGTP